MARVIFYMSLISGGGPGIKQLLHSVFFLSLAVFALSRLLAHSLSVNGYRFEYFTSFCSYTFGGGDIPRISFVLRRDPDVIPNTDTVVAVQRVSYVSHFFFPPV